MTEKLQETIKEQIAQLPKEIQDSINAVDWPKIAEEIGQKYDLDEADINNFQLETLLALTGITDMEFYAINIENQVETTKEKAENLASEALGKIFNPIQKIIDENIKKNLKDKDLNWQQNVSFVLSGGNYANLINNREEKDTTPSIPLVRGNNTTTPLPDKGEVGRGF